MEKAVIYNRVSHPEQTKGLSMEVQEDLCRKELIKRGFDVIKTFSDPGRTARNLNRPGLQDMLNFCRGKKDVSAVAVLETDRIARNAYDHLTLKAFFKKEGVQLISVRQPMINDTIEGELLDGILAQLNQFYSQLNGRKTRASLQKKFDSGGWPGWCPLGYLNRTVNDKKIVVPDPEKWNFIKEAFRMYLTGNYSVLEIVEELHKKGLRSKTNKKVPYSVMTNILKNPFYGGLMRWNKQEKTGNHKPIITMEEHRQVLMIMNSHNHHCCRRRKYSFLLNGFMFCDICDHRFVADRHRAGKISDYYHCSARSVEHSNKNQNVKTADLEKQVEEEFKNIRFNKKFIDLVIRKVKLFYKQKNKEIESQRRALFNQRNSIIKKRTLAEKKLLSGTLDDNDFKRIRDELRSELSLIDNSLHETEETHDVDVNTIRSALMLSRDVYRAYKQAPYEVKRLYLSFFWDKIWVRDKKIVRAKMTELFENLTEEKQLVSSVSGANFLLSPNWLPKQNIIKLSQ